MKNQLRSTLDMLREKVENNLIVIKQNEKKVRTILQNEPVSEERSGKLQENFDLNKDLLAENNDSINLQLEIVKYLEKYKSQLNEQGKEEQVTESIEEKTIDPEAYFQMTITGEMEYDEGHPFYQDPEFHDRLMNHYLANEDYEACDQLQRMKAESE